MVIKFKLEKHRSEDLLKKIGVAGELLGFKLETPETELESFRFKLEAGDESGALALIALFPEFKALKIEDKNGIAQPYVQPYGMRVETDGGIPGDTQEFPDPALDTYSSEACNYYEPFSKRWGMEFKIGYLPSIKFSFFLEES